MIKQHIKAWNVRNKLMFGFIITLEFLANLSINLEEVNL